MKERQDYIAKKRDESEQLHQWFWKTDDELKQINRNGEFDQKLYGLKQELTNTKTKLREVYYQNVEKNKELVDQHENAIVLEEWLHNMKEKIKNHK